MTALQQEPSAHAPWTRTMFGEVLIFMTPYRVSVTKLREVTGSRQRDPSDVDRHEERFWDELVVALVGVDAPFRGEHEAIDLLIIRGVVQPGRSTQDVNGVVVTAQEPVRAKAKDLLARVTLDFLREDHF